MGAFDSIKDKAKDLMGQHGDKVDPGVDKAGDAVDEKTGGQHADKVDTAQDKAKDAANQFGGGQNQGA